MVGAYYSVVGILAIILHMILNYDLYKKENDSPFIAVKEYKIYLASVFAYYVMDALWGLADSVGNITFLYTVTIAYFIAMASSVVFWCKYVIEYLDLDYLVADILSFFCQIFWILNLVLLVVNFFFPIFFWFDENGGYHVAFFRYVALAVQLIMFFAIAGISFYYAKKTKRDTKRRNMTMGLFGVAMIATVLIQATNVLLPIYTMGLMIGTCILHVFIQENQMDSYKDTLKNNSDIIASAGFGLWHILLNNEEAPRMQVNEKMAELLAINAEALEEEEIYNSWYGNIAPEAIPSVLASVEEMLAGKLSENTYKWRHPKKGFIYVRCGGVCTAVLEDGTKVISGYHSDVNEIVKEEKAHEKRLREAIKRAEAASAAKTTFLFNMSHDIRTPMNAIMGYTDLLEKYHNDPIRCLDYLAKIRSSSDFLLSLINNVLEMARIESGKVGLEEQPCCVEDVCREIEDVYSEQMRTKRIDFVLEHDIHTKYAYCDRVKLNEVFLNLVSNAYKYTPEGGKVSIKFEELPCERDGYMTMQVTVSDTGIGMDKEYLPTIFEEFSRERNTTAVKIQGTGLGMAIVKKLVDLMGGTITVESELGVGTTFTVTTSHKIADSPREKFEDSLEGIETIIKDFFGKRVLIAEDNDLNAEIAEEILKDEGLLVERAENGAVCLEMLQQAEEDYYQLILMDIQMPVMDGYEATKRIRGLKNKKKAQIPVIAMTANAFSEDKANAYAVGMNAHLSKPIDVNDMLEVLAIYLKNR